MTDPELVVELDKWMKYGEMGYLDAVLFESFRSRSAFMLINEYFVGAVFFSTLPCLISFYLFDKLFKSIDDMTYKVVPLLKIGL